MNTITEKAYAKINLFLEVCEKREDNYHNIDSVMQSVSLCDIITVSECDEIILSNNADLPNTSDNLAYKAAKAFFEYTNINKGAKIHIEKNIPISAGLAGGSTDAAATFKALNKLYNTNLSNDTLCSIGAKLGADIPFCIKSGTYITKGIGDILIPCSSLPDCYIVISKSGEGVSTPYAYKQIDEMRTTDNSKTKTSVGIVNKLEIGKIGDIANEMYNIFEKVVEPIRPKVKEQKDILSKYSPIYSMMSGSGPSVFGIFDNKRSAENALKELLQYGADAHLCTPV